MGINMKKMKWMLKALKKLWSLGKVFGVIKCKKHPFEKQKVAEKKPVKSRLGASTGKTLQSVNKKK